MDVPSEGLRNHGLWNGVGRSKSTNTMEAAMSRTHEEMRDAANDVLGNYVLRDDRRLVSREAKDAFYEVAAGVLAECVIALIAEIELPAQPPSETATKNNCRRPSGNLAGTGLPSLAM